MKTRYFKHRVGFWDGTDYISHCDGVTVCHAFNGKTTNVSDCWPLHKLLVCVEDGTFKEISNPTVVDLKKVKKVAKRWRKVPMTDIRLVFSHRTVTINDIREDDFIESDLLRVEIKS